MTTVCAHLHVNISKEMGVKLDKETCVSMWHSLYIQVLKVINNCKPKEPSLTINRTS
jgi:hypothetical protein